MLALTIDAPWAWAIIHGHKRIENRIWRTTHRGPIAIHASRSRRSDAPAAAIFAELGIEAPTGQALEALRGRVLGVVDVTDVVRYPDAGGDGLFDQGERQQLRDDPFASGPFCWVLASPVAIADPPFVVGQQLLWTLPSRSC